MIVTQSQYAATSIVSQQFLNHPTEKINVHQQEHPGTESIPSRTKRRNTIHHHLKVETSTSNFSKTHIRRRSSSARKNLPDPSLYQIPKTSNGYSSTSSVLLSSFIATNNSNAEQSYNQFNGNKDTSTHNIDSTKFKIKDLIPEIDTNVVGLCVTWYVTSSISSNLTKRILHQFPHPIALTELQFTITALICLVFISFVNTAITTNSSSSSICTKIVRSFPEGILPVYLNGNFKESILQVFIKPTKLILCTTFPMGIFQFLGYITSHKATKAIPVSVVHSIKALSPIMTVTFYKIVYKKDYKLMTYITLVPLILGVMITCASTHKSKKMNSTNNKNNNRLSDFAAGLIFAFISMIIFVSQNIFAKNILTVKRKDTLLKSKSNENVVEALRRAKQIYSPLQIDKITILFYCSCIGFLLDLPLFIYNEFSTRAIFSNLSIQTFLLILIHGVSHFIQAMLAFQLIGSLTPVNYSVANIMKRIVVILVALFWENRWSFNQVFGMSLTIFGLYSYDKWGKTKL